MKMHPKTLAKMAREGQIPAIRLGKHWRFRKSWLEAWIGSQLNPAEL
jgi:excisionase family DNA binding protein